MDKLSEQIRKSKTKIGEMEFSLAVERAVLARLVAMQNGEKESREDEPRPIVPNSIVTHIQSALKSVGRPMKVKQILRAIQQEGVEIEGKTDPKRLVSSAIVRRKDLFERVDRGLYRLKLETQEETSKET